ncbi:50S ribosomal protein L25/general stress protein Ctc [Candidatus Paracaedibacter symbiosus]|uniref:50S ribosomal protein L25/general stress protein Ctc n=1 Tax=Candidatus Paracaedibacter symbiosus TaxID=244582 RepID=UPI00050970A1|nr:50S ribosomal protein L25/general stress protein Ctc [Candidatus Paracaedibacter symbiosus]
MSSVETIVVQSRAASGTSAARATRKDGLVPGIVYGNNKEPQLIALDPRVLIKEMYKAGFFSRLFTISLDGKEQHVLAKDIQLHPVSDHPLHVDFQRVSKDAKITVNVPLSFINDDKAPGVKKGGAINIVHHNLEVTCPANAIPEQIVVDLSKLEINQGIHITDLALPKGVVPTHQERDATLVTIVGSSSDTAKEEA